jgi:hypothetical protein
VADWVARLSSWVSGYPQEILVDFIFSLAAGVNG